MRIGDVSAPWNSHPTNRNQPQWRSTSTLYVWLFARSKMPRWNVRFDGATNAPAVGIVTYDWVRGPMKIWRPLGGAVVDRNVLCALSSLVDALMKMQFRQIPVTQMSIRLPPESMFVNVEFWVPLATNPAYVNPRKAQSAMWTRCTPPTTSPMAPLFWFEEFWPSNVMFLIPSPENDIKMMSWSVLRTVPMFDQPAYDGAPAPCSQTRLP